jgi:hypothetical protein
MEKLRETLLAMGFRVSMLDPSLYILERDGEVLWLLDFVDDMLLGSLSLKLIQWVKDELLKSFKMTDLGEAEKYVGISILRDRAKGKMWLHQASYCADIAVKFGCVLPSYPETPLPSVFKVAYPWEADPDIPPPTDATLDPLLSPSDTTLYQQIVGSLHYAAATTRPDVAFAAAMLARVMSCPRGRHLVAARRAVAYLAGTPDLCLCFSASSGVVLDCYCDASFGGDPSHKSTSGYLLTLAGSPIYWASRKQDRITTSTCDAESQAVMAAVQHVESMRDQLEELGCIQTWPTPVYNDNSATVNLSINPKAHKKSVQLTRPMAYVRERTKLGVIAPLHVKTTDMPADFLTKNLPPEAFIRCRKQTGMEFLPPAPLKGEC